MITQNSITCFLKAPILLSSTQKILDKLFTDEEKSKKTFYSEINNFKLQFFDIFSIYYFGDYSVMNLKDKIFFEKSSRNSILIQSVEIINDEIIIDVLYENFNDKFNLNDTFYELDISEDKVSFFSLLKKYKTKPVSLYYNKIALNNFEKNKLTENFTIEKIENSTKRNRKNFIIIEKNKSTQKKQFYFYQKT